MSGKLSFIGVLATSIRKELAGCNIPELMERLSQMEEEIRGKHNDDEFFCRSQVSHGLSLS